MDLEKGWKKWWNIIQLRAGIEKESWGWYNKVAAAEKKTIVLQTNYVKW